MNVSLTNELEEYVSSQVKTGHYASASEVIREALRNQIRHSMSEQLDQRISNSRQQAKDGSLILADDGYFKSKRERIRQQFM